MLTKPEIADESIAACLLADYGLGVEELAFLPLGADRATAVYRVVAVGGRPYFLKLRRGDFKALSVALPRFLGEQGIGQIIAPLPTTTGQLQASMDEFRLVLYPFVAGRDGYEVKLSAGQWNAFGAALRHVHETRLPPDLLARINRETFSPRWREDVRRHLVQARTGPFADALAREAADFLIDKGDETLYLVERAEQLAAVFQTRAPEFVLCHADIHAGNLLLADNGGCYIVDWDEASLAPKERDLMSIGGGLMGHWYSPEEEETLFYAGYGRVEIDPFGLAYYRYERIIADIAVISEQLLAATDSLEDRRQFFAYLTSNFLPGHTIEMAYRADPARRDTVTGR